ncbi:hypothetical protein Hypma_011275 [Hypsizygus marmoreus]|uniref:Uncharacterized protein n=1 Tax=Hypsizygus marmoreus TaxID=39966 RepID=A0A369JIH2_HYPMA|nr:hypothetical protein Hypma_011275 [Hypsizygus marmoreus]
MSRSYPACEDPIHPHRLQHSARNKARDRHHVMLILILVNTCVIPTRLSSHRLIDAEYDIQEVAVTNQVSVVNTIQTALLLFIPQSIPHHPLAPYPG